VSRYSDVLSGVCAKNTGLGGVRALWCVMHPSTGIFAPGDGCLMQHSESPLGFREREVPFEPPRLRLVWSS